MSGAKKRDAKTGFWSVEDLESNSFKLPEDVDCSECFGDTVDYRILSVGAINPNLLNYAYVSTSNTELQSGEYLRPVFTDVRDDYLFDILFYAALNEPQDIILVGLAQQGLVAVIASALSQKAVKPPILQITPNAGDALEHVVNGQQMIVTPPKYFMSVFGSLLDEYVEDHDRVPESKELPAYTIKRPPTSYFARVPYSARQAASPSKPSIIIEQKKIIPDS